MRAPNASRGAASTNERGYPCAMSAASPAQRRLYPRTAFHYRYGACGTDYGSSAQAGTATQYRKERCFNSAVRGSRNRRHAHRCEASGSEGTIDGREPCCGCGYRVRELVRGRIVLARGEPPFRVQRCSRRKARPHGVSSLPRQLAALRNSRFHLWSRPSRLTNDHDNAISFTARKHQATTAGRLR